MTAQPPLRKGGREGEVDFGRWQRSGYQLGASKHLQVLVGGLFQPCVDLQVYTEIQQRVWTVMAVFAGVTHLGSASSCSPRQAEADRSDKGENKFADY